MSNHLISARRMISASLANVGFLIAHSLIFLLLTPKMLSVLGADLYGLWTIMLAVLGFAGLANFGVATTTIKFSSQFATSRKDNNKLSASITFSFLLMLATGLIASSLLFWLRHWISSGINPNPDTASLFSEALKWLAIGITPLFLSQASRGILLGLVYNELAGGIALLFDTLLWFGALGIGIMGKDISYLGLWTLIINLLRFLFLTFAAWRVTQPFNLRFVWDVTLTKKMLHYSILTWISSLGTAGFQTLDRILVGMILGASAAGVYGIASGISTRLYMLVSKFTQVLTPFASSYQEADELNKIRSAFRLSSRWGACILVLTASILMIWMDVLLNIWISPEFSEEYVSFFRILIIAYTIYSMVAPAYQIIVGLGWLKIPTIITISSGVGTLFTLWILAPIIGLTGTAYANLIYSAVLLISYYLAYRLEMKAIVVVLADLGPPLIVLLFIAFLPHQVLPLEARLAINFISIATISWLALSGGRYQLFLNAIRYH